jgi:hypothetical protein
MRRWLIAASCLAGLAGADTLLWRFAVGRLDAGLDRWMVQANARGWKVTTGGRERAGWPFDAVLVVSDIDAVGGDRLLPGGVSWQTSRLALTVSLAHPETLVVRVLGAQLVRLSHAPELIVNADKLSVRVPLAAHVPEAELDAVALGGGVRGAGHPGDLRIAQLHLYYIDDSAQHPAPTWLSARLEVEAHGIGLPDIGHWPLGGFVSGAGATILLSSPRLYAVSGWGTKVSADPEDQARMWRDGGGTLDLHGVHVHWGPLRLQADASLRLDSRLQPSGTGSADVEGSAASLDALAAGGVIPPGLAATAKAVLAVMPVAPDNPNAVRLPFVLRDTTLSVGQIPIVRLNEIVWTRHPPT